MMWFFPILLEFALYITVVDSGSPLIANSQGCWAKCGGGGRCTKICGENGYCCRKGYADCPARIAQFNPYKQHACVSLTNILAGPVLIPNSAGCWLKCRGGGPCPKICGENGYCCGRGYQDCPARISKVNTKRQHACIYVPKVLIGAKKQSQQDKKKKCVKEDNVKQAANCKQWAARGECGRSSAKWMKDNCACSCKTIKTSKKKNCVKDDIKKYAASCRKWAASGECHKKSAEFMKKNCGCSCQTVAKSQKKKCAKADNKKYAANCKRWAASWECEKTKSTWMKKNCACSCKTVKRRPKKNLKYNQKYCGLTLNRGRIVGGKDAKLGEWPWQIGLVVKSKPSIVKCGGTLISSRAIITAAHCFRGIMNPDPSNYLVRLGDLNLDKKEDGEEVVKIKKIIKHQQFVESTYENDITILILEKDVTHKSYVGAACVPVGDIDIPDGRKCVITGWGSIKENEDPARVLQKVKVPIVNKKVCSKAYARIDKNAIKKGMFCAGFKQGGIDSCQGDSGGPLVCLNSNGKYYLYGIISWGAGCARPGYYGVYAKVSHYTAWINKALRSS